jgi:hypothetical protein
MKNMYDGLPIALYSYNHEMFKELNQFYNSTL